MSAFAMVSGRRPGRLIAGLALVVGTIGGGSVGLVAADPIDVSWLPVEPEIGETVVFEITGVPAVDIEAAEWSFGGLGCDGSTSFECTAVPTLCDAASFQYASAGDKTVSVTATVNGVVQLPVVRQLTVQPSGSCSGSSGAGLAVVPTTPDIGEVALFEVTGFAGPVRSLWDFGENGCDGHLQFQSCDPGLIDCLEAAFRFASSGDKNVAVVIEDPSTGGVMGTANRSFSVDPTGSCGGGGERYVMQSFLADGVGGSIFRHEMELFNPDRNDATVRVDWLPQNQANPTPALVGFVPVPAGTAVRIDNVLGDVLGLGPPAIGLLRLAEIPDAIRVSNLGLNDSASGSYGWTIPVGEPADGLVMGEAGFIPGLGEDDDVRTNLVCDNWSDVPVVVGLDLVDASGTLLQTSPIQVPPNSIVQLNRIFQSFAPVDGYVRASHAHPDGRVACFGAVGANTTSDFLSQPQSRASGPGEVLVAPRAIHDAQRTTDLIILAPAGAAQYRIDWLPSGQDNTTFQSMAFALADQQQVRFNEAVISIFSTTGTGSLRVVPTSGSVLAAAVERTLATGEEQLRRAHVRTIDDHVPAKHPASIIHLTEGVRHRTDIGVANTSATAIDVAIQLRDAAGTVLGARRTSVPPYSHVELTGVFAAIGEPNVADGRARIWTLTDGGSFLAYGVVTELDTLDSWEMPAEALPVELFADGFESGDTSAWSQFTP